jgi:threonine/homoserine/homoserine lactone efflux protein
MQIAPGQASSLIESASHAFDSGVALTAGIAAGLAVVVAVCVGRLLRGVR